MEEKFAQRPLIVAALMTSAVAGWGYIIRSVADGEWIIVGVSGGLYLLFAGCLVYIKRDYEKSKK